MITAFQGFLFAGCSTYRVKPRPCREPAQGIASVVAGLRQFMLFPAVFCSLMVCFPVMAAGSTYISVGNDLYAILSRLETEGVIRSAILSLRPISRDDAERLVREAEEHKEQDPFVRDLVREARRQLDGTGGGSEKERFPEAVYAQYVFTRAPVTTSSYPGAVRVSQQAFNYNNDGDLYESGSSYRLGLALRLEQLGPFSAYLVPEFRLSGSLEQGVLKEGYGVLGFSWMDVVAGKAAQWWGPGFHGALLLSNNAEPQTMVRVTSPTARILPGFLKYLGWFKYALFVSQLENDRPDFARPYFWGMRLAFKPLTAVEVGVERTGILGGQGRSAKANVWFHSILGSREHAELNPGDQRTAYDLKVTLPFRLQPIQIYWVQAGEENWPRDPQHGYRYASLYGLYLPRLFGIDRLEFRAEFAKNHVRNAPFVWYTHGIYTAGYTYKGVIMGHHMGVNAADLFAEVAVRVPELESRFSVSFDHTKRDLPSLIREDEKEMVIGAAVRVSDHLDMKMAQGAAWVENSEGVPGRITRSVQTQLSLEYLF